VGTRRDCGSAGGRRVYALIDAQGAGGLYRSDDSGANWIRTSSDARIFSRNWYFAGITVDPRNPDLVYVPNVALYRSTDGGRNFTVLKGAPGGDDYRILWVTPLTPSHDPGPAIREPTSAWTPAPPGPPGTTSHRPDVPRHHGQSVPLSRLRFQQDSGTAAIPSRTNHGMIDARDWYSVGGAEKRLHRRGSEEPNILFVSNTNGTLARFDKRTGQSQNVTPNIGP